jgi:hypothetical protein
MSRASIALKLSEELVAATKRIAELELSRNEAARGANRLAELLRLEQEAHQRTKQDLLGLVRKYHDMAYQC